MKDKLKPVSALVIVVFKVKLKTTTIVDQYNASSKD